MKNALGRRIITGEKGETITETLVSVLIASLGLIMLAGAISAASHVVMKSRDKMTEYYEADQNVAKKEGDGVKPIELTLSGDSKTQSFPQAKLFSNENMSKNVVFSYKYTPTPTPTP